MCAVHSKKQEKKYFHTLFYYVHTIVDAVKVLTQKREKHTHTLQTSFE